MSTAVDLDYGRLPFEKAVTALADRGHWPALERVANAHGWRSPEVRAFALANLPIEACGICGAQYIRISKRVRYCSDRCRRHVGYVRDVRRMGALLPLAPRPAPVPLSSFANCLMVRGEDDRRQSYLIQVRQTRLGEWCVFVRWGLVAGQVWRCRCDIFPTSDAALACAVLRRKAAINRGYKEEEAS